MSRWGSFLQNAVANVESGLDKILADDTSTSKSSTSAAGRDVQNGSSSAPQSKSDLSRRPSTAKKNDRLQQRLAKAVVSRSGSRPPQTEASSSTSTTPRPSLDSKGDDEHYLRGSTESAPSTEAVAGDLNNEIRADDTAPGRDTEALLKSHTYPEAEEPATGDATSECQSSPHALQGLARETLDVRGRTDERSAGASSELVHDQEVTSALSADEGEQRRTINQYMERVDALQAKLQYLSREAAETARKIANEADAGSVVRKLAEKDEKIALLMDEGQKLSQVEFNHRSLIRKLRVKVLEDERQLSSCKKIIEETGRELGTLQGKVKRTEAIEKHISGSNAALQKAERDLERLRSENISNTALILKLQEELKHARDTEATVGAKKYKALLEAEKRLTSELRDDVSTAKIEKELSDNRHRRQIQEMQDKIEREKGRAMAVDLELRGEIGALESRLEASRARAEEVSTGSAGDSHVKLLRQLETLQSQYSVASENWRGIESSLLARIAGLEKEREDWNKKDADLRRRLRDSITKNRQLEDKLERAASSNQGIEDSLADERAKAQDLQHALNQAKAEIRKAQEDLRTAKEAWEARLERAEAEKQESMLETPYSNSYSHSPISSGFKKATTEKAGVHGRRTQTNSPRVSNGYMTPLVDRSLSRRGSAQLLHLSNRSTSQHKDSAVAIAYAPSRIDMPDTPSIQSEHQDDAFDGLVTPATPERTINEMLSISTAAAGPSVQLVERMSAAVRRLESEKAGSREELERLSGQRDEAREQVVVLMREVEEKRSVDKKIDDLEAEVAEIRQRYETTLELLGEKSELVEELRADIADMKQIYRETLERAVK